MKRIAVTIGFLCAFTLGLGQTSDETVQVRLMLIETLVTDASGEAIRGLTKDDFQMTVKNQIKPIDTVDEVCHADDERPDIPGLDPRFVLAFDYYSLSERDRRWVLQGAAETLKKAKKPDDLVMIVSLAHDMRVEQRFTKDLDELLDVLERMEFDRSLYARNFGHIKTKTYFQNMSTLMDVLAAYDGTKAILLYSAILQIPDDSEAEYVDVTTRAAVARAVIYPTGLRGLQYPRPIGQSSEKPQTPVRVLERFATDTGGAVGNKGMEATKLYGQVQRELGCRYLLGFYLGPDAAVAPQEVFISVKRAKTTVRYPGQVRLWSADETRASRMRAAFSDPEQFDQPLLRTIAFPMRPNSTGNWDTYLAVHAPVPIERGGEAINVSAELFRDREKLATFTKDVTLDAPASGRGTVPFTMGGDASLKPGAYELRFVLSKPGQKRVVSRVAPFVVPEIPKGQLILRGPLLARVEDEGVAVRADDQEPVLLKQTIGEGKTFEPLTVHEIKPDDTLLVYWETCYDWKSPPMSGARIDRNIVDEDGNVVYQLDSVRLEFEGDDYYKCARGLDRFDPGKLDKGRYSVVLNVRRSGEQITQNTAPLLVD